MTPSQLEEFRTKLTDLLARAQDGSFRSVLDGTEPPPAQTEPRDPADTAELEIERAAAYSMGERDADLANAISAALERIEAGTYGRCGVDGKPIELERLRLVPWTDRCVEHKPR